MEYPMIGTIVAWAGHLIPKGWLLCDGSLLQISQNQALFSLLGTIYGGDGRTTFALPNLSCRFAAGAASNQGLAQGSASITLTTANLPVHTHDFGPTAATMPTTLNSAKAAASAPFAPGNSVLGTAPSKFNMYKTGGTGDTEIAGLSVNTTLPCGYAGRPAPIKTLPPYQATYFIIATAGYYPPRP